MRFKLKKINFVIIWQESQSGRPGFQNYDGGIPGGNFQVITPARRPGEWTKRETGRRLIHCSLSIASNLCIHLLKWWLGAGPFHDCNTVEKDTSEDLSSPAHVIRPLLWVVLSLSLLLKALESAAFMVHVWENNKGYKNNGQARSLHVKILDSVALTVWTWKNATCLRDHFAQCDFKKSLPFRKSANNEIMHNSRIFRDTSLALNNWGQKYS